MPELFLFSEPTDVEEFPDEWFTRLGGRGRVPSPRGFLFLSRLGYENLRSELLATYARSGGDPQDFQVAAANHFAEVDQAVARKIAQHERAIHRLQTARY